jgi:MerR family mercuric resistance operon transcriptional regulator
MESSEMTIARAAKAAGVGVETVRYYERRGLVQQPASDGGYRRYGAEQIDRIRFVKRAQALGFTLEEVESLLKLQDGTDRRSIRQIAGNRLEEIRGRITDLQRLENALAHLLSECEKGHTRHCPIVEAISGKRH